MDAVCLNTGLTEYERLSLDILGPGRVLGYQGVCCAWQTDVLETEPVVLHSEDVLRECARDNATGEADWRLSYALGLSLRTQRSKMGWNCKKKPYVNPTYKWWLESEEDSWATEPVEPGYRLLDFTRRQVEDQRDEIAMLGTDFEPAEEQVVAEICFSNYPLSPNKERLLNGWYHVGRLRSDRYGRVHVGNFDGCGFSVRCTWYDRTFDPLGVVVSRKAAWHS